MTTPKDKYDLAVEYLTENTDEIDFAWSHPLVHVHGCLFSPVVPHDEWSDGIFPIARGRMCGCLTQIRNGSAVAWTPELTTAIQIDSRLPTDPEQITTEDLKYFADWQRRIDKELNRV